MSRSLLFSTRTSWTILSQQRTAKGLHVEKVIGSSSKAVLMVPIESFMARWVLVNQLVSSTQGTR